MGTAICKLLSCTFSKRYWFIKIPIFTAGNCWIKNRIPFSGQAPQVHLYPGNVLHGPQDYRGVCVVAPADLAEGSGVILRRKGTMTQLPASMRKIMILSNTKVCRGAKTWVPDEWICCQLSGKPNNYIKIGSGRCLKKYSNQPIFQIFRRKLCRTSNAWSALDRSCWVHPCFIQSSFVESGFAKPFNPEKVK